MPEFEYQAYLYDGDVGLYDGDVGVYPCGDIGEFELCGLYDGLIEVCELWKLLVGLYVGLTGE